jgi:hypothetical protein
MPRARAARGLGRPTRMGQPARSGLFGAGRRGSCEAGCPHGTGGPPARGRENAQSPDAPGSGSGRCEGQGKATLDASRGGASQSAEDRTSGRGRNCMDRPPQDRRLVPVGSPLDLQRGPRALLADGRRKGCDPDEGEGKEREEDADHVGIEPRATQCVKTAEPLRRVLPPASHPDRPRDTSPASATAAGLYAGADPTRRS